MGGAEGMLLPILGSVVGGMFGGQNNQPSMQYSQPPPAQIHPLYEPLIGALSQMYQNMLTQGPRGQLFSQGGYIPQLFNQGQGPQSIFGQMNPVAQPSPTPARPSNVPPLGQPIGSWNPFALQNPTDLSNIQR